MDIVNEKEAVRSMMRIKLKSHPAEERERKSREIIDKLMRDEAFHRSKSILFYFAMGEEVQTEELIRGALRSGKQVSLPYIDENTREMLISRIQDIDIDLIAGTYGIMVPKKEIRKSISSHELELVIVPGLAFDHANYRLGRGRGYYDRFLAKLPRHVRTFGLAFDFQIVKALPVTELDIPLSRVFHN